ncbi:family 16 glycoside hydrolase [Maioricimonas rarisocia]
MALLPLMFSPLAHAEEHRTLLFQDDFERNESQEEKDEIGNGWGTNSARRAGGNRQVDLKDGAMHIFIHETADHAVSVTHPAEFTDGVVELDFMLPGPKDNLGLNFADLQFKEVHAGHLFVVRISTKSADLIDLKTGNMDLEIRELRRAKRLSQAQQQMLDTKRARFPLELKPGKWYRAAVTVRGESLHLAIDGKTVGTFASEGIAHPTKRLLRLSVPGRAVVDNVKIFALNQAETATP